MIVDFSKDNLFYISTSALSSLSKGCIINTMRIVYTYLLLFLVIFALHSVKARKRRCLLSSEHLLLVFYTFHSYVKYYFDEIDPSYYKYVTLKENAFYPNNSFPIYIVRNKVYEVNDDGTDRSCVISMYTINDINEAESYKCVLVGRTTKSISCSKSGLVDKEILVVNNELTINTMGTLETILPENNCNSDYIKFSDGVEEKVFKKVRSTNSQCMNKICPQGSDGMIYFHNKDDFHLTRKINGWYIRIDNDQPNQCEFQRSCQSCSSWSALSHKCVYDHTASLDCVPFTTGICTQVPSDLMETPKLLQQVIVMVLLKAIIKNPIMFSESVADIEGDYFILHEEKLMEDMTALFYIVYSTLMYHYISDIDVEYQINYKIALEKEWFEFLFFQCVEAMEANIPSMERLPRNQEVSDLTETLYNIKLYKHDFDSEW